MKKLLVIFVLFMTNASVVRAQDTLYNPLSQFTLPISINGIIDFNQFQNIRDDELTSRISVDFSTGVFIQDRWSASFVFGWSEHEWKTDKSRLIRLGVNSHYYFKLDKSNKRFIAPNIGLGGLKYFRAFEMDSLRVNYQVPGAYMRFGIAYTSFISKNVAIEVHPFYEGAWIDFPAEISEKMIFRSSFELSIGLRIFLHQKEEL